MKEKSTLARPYALAVFKLASQEGDLSGWSNTLQALSALVAEPAMRELIANPRVLRSKLAALFIELLGDGIAPAGRNLVQLLVERGRLGLMPEISRLYELQRAEAERRASVQVRSAYPLTDEFRTRIVAAVERRLGRAVEVTEEVDPSLIGGAVVRVGDLVIDLSLRGRLRQLSVGMS